MPNNPTNKGPEEVCLHKSGRNVLYWVPYEGELVAWRLDGAGGRVHGAYRSEAVPAHVRRLQEDGGMPSYVAVLDTFCAALAAVEDLGEEHPARAVVFAAMPDYAEAACQNILPDLQIRVEGGPRFPLRVLRYMVNALSAAQGVLPQ